MPLIAFVFLLVMALVAALLGAIFWTCAHDSRDPILDLDPGPNPFRRPIGDELHDLLDRPNDGPVGPVPSPGARQSVRSDRSVRSNPNPQLTLL